MKIPIIYKDPFTGRYTLGWQRISKSGNKILDIDQLFKDINDKKCSVDDIDWRGQFKEIERVHKAIKKSTTYCWLYPFLFQIQDSKLRNEVLRYLRYGSASILNRNEYYEFRIDCDCMEKVFLHVKKLPTFGYLLKKDPPKEKEWLIRLALTFEDTYIEIYPERFVALIQEIYNEDEKGNRMDKISSIFRSVRIIGDLSINNCIDFCKYMLIAEGYRQWLITDNSSTKQPNLESLHRKLRNKCFDIYIQSRFREVQAEMDEDNTRFLDPTDAEVYNKLYEQEREFIEKERTNNTTEDIIILSSYLIEYLKLKLPETSKQQAKQSEIIQHDRKENHQFNEKMPTQEQLEKTFTYVYRNDKRAFYPHLIEFLLQERDRTDHFADADWARHALVIYEQRPTILKHIPSTFAAWLKEFSKMFGRECKTMYEPGKIKKRRKSAAINFMPTNTTSSVG